MNRKMPYDQTLILTTLGLVGFGLMMVFSASAPVSRELYGEGTSIFVRQFIAVGLGLIGLFIAVNIDYQNYAKAWIVYSAVVLAAILLVVPHVIGSGDAVARWIRIGPMQFQPSELAKLAAILFTSFFLTRAGTDLGSFRRGVLPFIAVLGALIGLVLAGSDLGTAACIALVSGLLLYFGGMRYRHVPVLAAIGAVIFTLLVALEPYRLQRIWSYLNPGDDPSGAGYQIRQSLIAVGSGGISGVGYADGTQKLHYLPEPHTDFIFAVIGEELGLAGCLLLVLLFSLFLWRGVRIALRADTPFGAYMALGIVSMVVLQAVINMSVVLRLLPTKGIPLPFVSVGGSSMLIMLAAVGVLINISKHTRGRSVRLRK